MIARLTVLAILSAGIGASLYGGNWLCLGAAFIASLAFVTFGVVRPRSQVFGPVMWRGPSTGRAEVAISFDDGPDPQTTDQILRILERHQAKATFFVIGRKALAQAALTKQIIDGGHELANHSFSHDRWLNFRGQSAHLREMKQCQQVLADMNAPSPWYRPPMGLTSAPALAAAQKAGLRVVCWSVSAKDGGSSGCEAAKRRLAKVRAGDIVLLHDGHDLDGQTRTTAVEVMPWFLEWLSQQGLRAVTLSALCASAGE